MVTEYLNINAFFDYDIKFERDDITPPAPCPTSTLPSLIEELELSQSQFIAIPPEVLRVYSRFRPTPLFRAINFEKAIGTKSEIYIKDESKTPTGNHKINSAYLIAYLCMQSGVRLITTETTGNWGVALAIACREFGLESLSFLDSVSNLERPRTRYDIETQGGNVRVVDCGEKYGDLLTLSAEAAIDYTVGIDQAAAYVFGSVYGYFIVAQSLMGLEAREQLALLGKTPDLVVGSCGGGANLLGIAAPFIADSLQGKWKGRIVSAESEKCPILSAGVLGWRSIDTSGYYPSIRTYGIPGLLDDEYIGGLGSTIVAGGAAHYHRTGLIEAQVINSSSALTAARLFEKSEGIRVALETSYQLAAVVHEAKRPKKKIVLVNISTGDNEALFYSRKPGQFVGRKEEESLSWTHLAST